MPVRLRPKGASHHAEHPQRNDARDIVQDTAVGLWQHFAQYDAERPFVNWALGFARMHVRRFFRAVERRSRLRACPANIWSHYSAAVEVVRRRAL